MKRNVLRSQRICWSKPCSCLQLKVNLINRMKALCNFYFLRFTTPAIGVFFAR